MLILYRVVTETSRGESQSTYVATLSGFERFVEFFLSDARIRTTFDGRRS
jgi:hypothetical protein